MNNISIGIKFGAEVEGLETEMLIGLGIVYGLLVANNRDLTVTSGNEDIPVHRENSWHYKNRAIDIRTRDWSPSERVRIYALIKTTLDFIGFDVVLEKDHIHIEYDPHPGDKPLLRDVA